jgi:hypothetical protein
VGLRVHPLESRGLVEKPVESGVISVDPLSLVLDLDKKRDGRCRETEMINDGDVSHRINGPAGDCFSEKTAYVTSLGIL